MWEHQSPCYKCFRRAQTGAFTSWQPKEDTVKYRVLKEISLLTLAQAGPKGCKEFLCAWEDLQDYMVRNGRKTGWFINKGDGKEESNFVLLIKWAEEDPKRIAWLIEKGFIEREEPELRACPFHSGDRQVFTEYNSGFYVKCNFCEARGPLCEKQEDAISGWNRRA